jgi:hypothetical protein
MYLSKLQGNFVVYMSEEYKLLLKYWKEDVCFLD